MKNAILYYYNMEPKEIHQINRIYKFKNNSQRYILYPCHRDIKEIHDIYEISIYLNMLGKYCHKIILNNKNEIYTNINAIKYVLLETNVDERKITTGDLKKYSNLIIDKNKFENLKRNNWHKLWSKKIDYMEYQLTQFGKKNQRLKDSSIYFIGIAENCITMLSQINNNIDTLTISHKRIKENTTTDEFYNPLNFIIDYRERDIGEYIKANLYGNDIIEKINKIINIYQRGIIRNDILFIRILYPSTYIDLFEEIIENEIGDERIKDITNYIEKYEKTIKKIYHYFRSISSIPEIQWLEDN